MLCSGIRNAALTGVAVVMLLGAAGFYASRPGAGDSLLTSIEARKQEISNVHGSAAKELPNGKSSSRGVADSQRGKDQMKRFAAFLLLVPYLSHADKI